MLLLVVCGPVVAALLGLLLGFCFSRYPGLFFIGLVGSDVDQRGHMTDVGKFQCFAATVQSGDGQLDAPTVQLIREGLFVEVAEVLHADFVQWNQHIAKGAIEQFHCG